jgi:hypothetical protein
VKREQDSGVGKPITSPPPPTPKPAVSNELNYVPFISAVREYGLVHSAHTRNLSSAHVPSHCNRALHVLRMQIKTASKSTDFKRNRHHFV